MYYRNKEDLTSLEGIEVEAGSLWELEGKNTLVLIDDDQYVSATLNSENFNCVTEEIPDRGTDEISMEFWWEDRDYSSPEPETVKLPSGKILKFNSALFHACFDMGKYSFEEMLNDRRSKE